MFHCVKRTPDVLFHFTLKNNADKIINDMCIKKFKDSHTWFFENLEDTISYFETYMMSNNHHCIGTDGILRHIGNATKDDYVILKFKTKYKDPLNWFVYEPHIPSNIDKNIPINTPYDNSVAYKGNLKIKDIEIISF